MLVLALGMAAFGSLPLPANAQATIGVVVNDTADSITVFNADTLAILGTAPLPVVGATCCDVQISADQRWAFIGRFVANNNSLVVFDISNPAAPTVAATLPLPAAIEDLSLVPGGRYLLASDGSGAAPAISINITNPAAPVIASQITPGGSDSNSIAACSDAATALTTSFNTDFTRRLAIDAGGILTAPGPNLAGINPNSTECAPGSRSGATVLRDSGTLQSFVLPAMTVVSNQVLPGSGLGINVVINNAGTVVFGRRGTTGLTAYDYNSATGAIGAQIWTLATPGRPTFFGMDQMDITPNDQRLFVSTATGVLALDAATGATLGTIAVTNPTGIAFRRGAGSGPPPVGVDPDRQLGKQVHLPILNFQGQDDVCRTWIEIQNIGPDFAKAVLVTWGEPGFCPPQCAGPLKVECSGLLKPGSTWNMMGAQIPTGSKGGMLFKFSARQISDLFPGNGGDDDIVADAMCEDLFFGVVGDCDDYRRFKKAYNEGLDWGPRGLNMRTASGSGALAVDVLRHCPGDVTPGVEVSSKYNGIAGTHLGAFDPIYGGYGFYVPLLYADKAGFNSIMYIQNGGLECSSIEIWFKAQDDCLRARICEIFTLAPGETYQWDASDCVGPDWQGSAWLRSTQPLGIVVDIIGRDVLMSYMGEPAAYEYYGDPEDSGDDQVFNEGDQVAFGPLMYSEYQGWDTGVQVQNLSPVVNAKVKVYFLDRSGDIITTLVDWICPRGSQTFFLPVIADLPGNWVGSIRVESQEWWTPGSPAVSPPSIVGVATLIKYNDAARTNTTEAIAYNLLPEHKIYIWQIGSGPWGGTFSGVGLIALPSLLKDLEGVGLTSEVAIANVVPKPGFTDFAIFIFDQNGLLDYVCQKLNEKQVEYIDLQTWGYVNPGFKGSAVISAVFWEHDVFGPTGVFERNVLGLGAVSVERTGTRLGEDVPGDEAAGERGIPFGEDTAFMFMGPNAPNCPGIGRIPQP